MPKRSTKIKEVAPHSIDAEMSVLGAMLMDRTVLDRGLEQLSEDDFYLPAHRTIFRAIVQSYNEHRVADPVMVKDILEKEGTLLEIGGEDYLVSLIQNVLSLAVFDRHVELVLEKSLNRKVIKAAEEVMRKAITESLKGDELLDFAEQKILEIREKGVRKGFYGIAEMVHGIYTYLEKIRREGKNVTGLPTGFRDLDELTSGLHDSDFIILASRPSMGKTSLALNIIRNVAVKEHIPVAFFSVEMSREQIALRFMCMEAQVSISKARSGRLNNAEMKKIMDAVEELEKAPIYIDDTSGIHLLELKAKARRIKREHGVKLIVIDYLQLVNAPEQENRQQQVSLISRELKALARELNVPVLALAQLSRAAVKREDKRPQLSDLRESGSLEQDADLVLMLHRPDKEDRKNEETEPVQVIIAKQRNGPIGDVKLLFIKPYTRFEDAALDEADQVEPYEGDLYF